MDDESIVIHTTNEDHGERTLRGKRTENTSMLKNEENTMLN
jgi:hypothetical protein